MNKLGIIFDTNKKRRELKIPDNIYESIMNEIRAEFPNDEMMFELHVIRALMSYARRKMER